MPDKDFITCTCTMLAETVNTTVSNLYVDNEYVCNILEDGYRRHKVHGDTRIDPGLFKCSRHKEGGFYEKYKKRFAHRKDQGHAYYGQWILSIDDVPRHKLIRVHIGNLPHRTATKPKGESLGCPLTNSGYALGPDGHYYGIGSEKAFLRLMDKLCAMDESKDIYWHVDRDDNQYVRP